MSWVIKSAYIQLFKCEMFSVYDSSLRLKPLRDCIFKVKVAVGYW